MMKRLAYLGPAGTYTEQAAMSHDPTATLIPCSSFPAVAASVESGQADQGVLAIENSLEGSVTFTLDLLIHQSGLFVRNELVLPIRHCLMAKPGASAEDIKIIYSHPQALAQVSRVSVGPLPARPSDSLVEHLSGRRGDAGE